ncbi:MAG: hypothetical protein HGGPFJEG_01492 [Ignavibacteria bacterium]|nr:hypothetical protein [Ignavibacteria bacterium]
MKNFILIFIIFLSVNVFSQTEQNDSYNFFVDLNNAEGNTLSVDLITPVIHSSTIEYKFPAMVPGTYKVYNFGRFVSELKAFDKSGSELQTFSKDVNTWEISGADNLYRLTYKVRETFGDTTRPYVFEPVGTCIKKDTVFVFNNHGFFGYFDGYLENDYRITFRKPEGFYGSTSLDAVYRNDSEEVFHSGDYQFLVDDPIMFNVPDTLTINFDESEVLVSVFSPGKGIKASDMKDKLTTLLNAIRNYLGGKLPSDKYSFLYFFSNEKGSGGFGALEHNLSSLYYMPDVPRQAATYMVDQLQGTSAHEFYHIVTPLNLHSEEIGIFDFNNPKMSRHLWLYEGVTEYHADYIRLRENIISEDDYIKIIEDKLNGASKYNDTLAFTELSLGALDKHEDQYLNVYQKGALIGLCLDILIRNESDGRQGIQDVINELTKKYGMNNPFKDENLFKDIEELTSPKVGEFIKKYLDGYEKIPYKEILGLVGIDVESMPYSVVNTGGGLSMGFNQKTFRLVIEKIENSNNEFINSLGLKAGDELISVNGANINFMNVRSMFGSMKNQIKKGDDIEIVVARFDEKGNENQIALKTKVKETKTAYEYKLKEIADVNEKQKKIKNAWLGK